jgi:hypothetical protein
MADIEPPARRKILIVGASGFIGARLTEKLADNNEFEITALVRDANKVKPLQTRGVHTIVANLSNYPGIDSAVRGYHTVFNLAHDFKRSQKINLRNFANLSNACTKIGRFQISQRNLHAAGWAQSTKIPRLPLRMLCSRIQKKACCIQASFNLPLFMVHVAGYGRIA